MSGVFAEADQIDVDGGSWKKEMGGSRPRGPGHGEDPSQLLLLLL